MKLKSYLLLLLLFISSFGAYPQSVEKVKTVSPQSAYNIIPKPVAVALIKDEAVIINRFTPIKTDNQFSEQGVYLSEQLVNLCGLQLSVLSGSPEKSKTSAIVLQYDSVAVDKPEMYLLAIKNNRVILKARDIAGIVYGIQTLLQLFPLAQAETIILPSMEIEDYPRFSYRGMHLDVSRHFFPSEFIKKYIDYLTFHKFNTFHWHLTDDHGWRIEIKSYPKLTETGAWRDSTLIGHFKDKPVRYDGKRYGGFYTQDEVKDIIKYASVRGINIIPEIDIPGHSRAAIASYPEFSTRPDTIWKVATTWGTFNRQNNVLAPTEATFEFLKRTFNEIADLFPSPYIHIGGDECSKIWWKADPKTQAFIKTHRLKDEEGLQTFMIQQVINNLKLKGKKVIGWDEILEGELDTSAIIMNWRSEDEAVKAAQRNHNVIMTPDKPLYFNYYQSREKDSLAIFGYNTLDAVYSYEPVPAKLDSLGLNYRVLGAQGNVWTEYMQYPSKVEYMIFPRMTALSEVLWTDRKNKEYTDFKRRLKENVIPRYEFWSSSYFKEYEYWTSDTK